MKALADNDILLKGACYGLLRTFKETLPGDGPLGILGTSRFVVPKRIPQRGLRGDGAKAQADFTAFVAENEILEPTPDEQQFAAALEAAAQQMTLSLDIGESQLAAVFACRLLPWLLTGDKRAIMALEKLLDSEVRLARLSGRIRCLEQLVSAAVCSAGVEQIRSAICAEPAVDKALSICFSCNSPDVRSDQPLEGLASYISDLHKGAPRVLST
jgi:hypothetical protein